MAIERLLAKLQSTHDVLALMMFPDGLPQGAGRGHNHGKSCLKMHSSFPMTLGFARKACGGRQTLYYQNLDFSRENF